MTKKFFRGTSVYGGLMAFALATPSFTFAQTVEPGAEAKIPAIVVVRHGEDMEGDRISVDPATMKGVPAGVVPWQQQVVETWPRYTILPANTYKRSVSVDADGKPQFTDKKETELVLRQHGLSGEGKYDAKGKLIKAAGDQQAIFLGENLDKILSDLGFAKITKAVTKWPVPKDGDGDWPTPNPFDTIYPYLKKSPDVELILIKPDAKTNGVKPLVDSALAAMLPDFHKPTDKDPTPKVNPGLLMQETGSTLLSWDAEGLWGGDEKVNGKKTRVWNPHGILAELGCPFFDDHFASMTTDPLTGKFVEGRGIPDKGSRIYVFYKRSPNLPLVPEGYDCVVLEVPPDLSNIIVRAYLEINAEKGTVKSYPNKVVEYLKTQGLPVPAQ